ncbi:charged multivesicular body protein 6-A [Contarinia nasturtii]|uniref:charged multivesicular body protein 6-A n=1 Tax=Contarinia nasturtii TaxID=265458 RepID=UPI0012D436C9|nr:charged multivesicular body protein 6-A [Contarinia nasturtii]XP_031630679.1 charged multivesicular body protein 6-A [Contarinia nasturtii]
MGNLFGKTKKTAPSRVTEHDKAVLQLKQQRDKLKQYQKRIELTLEKDRELAKKCLATGRKDRARALLRKKKYQEKLLETTDGQLENLEKLTSDLEFSQIEQKVLDGLKVGNEALKKVHEILTIDEVERILDETREGVDKQREIDAAINQYADSALTEEDEEEVLAELNKLIGADEKVTDLTEDKTIDLPEVPADALPSAEETTEDKPSKAKKVKSEPVALEA